MAYSTKNIIVGAAALYVSVLDSSNPSFYGINGNVATVRPAFTAATPASAAMTAASATWTHVGFTSNGIELSYEPTFGEVAVDQLLDAAKMFKSGMKATVKTSLAEATLENLIIAWGQKASTIAATITPDVGEELSISGGALYDEPVERSLIFIGPAPKSVTTGVKRERVYHVRRALNVTATAHALKKDTATEIPVDLRLLPDPYYSGKEYGVILDREVA